MRTKAKAAAVFRAMQGNRLCEADKAGRGHYLCGNYAKWMATVMQPEGYWPRWKEMKLCTLHANRYLAVGEPLMAGPLSPL